MKVLFFTLYDNIGASSRIRVYQYLPLLKEKGVSFTVRPAITNRYYKYVTGIIDQKTVCDHIYMKYNQLILLIKRIFEILYYAPKHDIIFIQKDYFYFGKFNLLKLLKIVNSNIIYDFDDAIFTSDSFQGLSKDKRDKLPIKLRNIIKAAKWVITTNEYCKDFALKYNRNVSIISGPIDTSKYKPMSKNNGHKIVIGWIGSPATTNYLYSLANVLNRLSQRYEHLVMMTIGAKNLNLNGLKIEKLDWNLENEVSSLNKFDIGIMPLADDAWTRGKGGFKLLQHMAVGVPSVASPVGINNEIISEGINGYLAHTEEEWYEKLSLLIEDKKLREKMGKAARETCLTKYSVDSGFPKLMQIFERMTNTN